MAENSSEVVFIGIALPPHTWAFLAASAVSSVLAFLNFWHSRGVKKETARVEREAKQRQAKQNTFDRDIATPVIARLENLETTIDTILCTNMVASIDDAKRDLKECNKPLIDEMAIVEATVSRVRNDHTIFGDDVFQSLGEKASSITDIVNAMFGVADMKGYAERLDRFKTESAEYSGVIRRELKRYEDDEIFK